MDKVKGLGFCVSKEHAEYMATMFNKADIPSIALTADSKKEERNSAQSRLRNGKIKFIFTIDLCDGDVSHTAAGLAIGIYGDTDGDLAVQAIQTFHRKFNLV